MMIEKSDACALTMEQNVSEIFVDHVNFMQLTFPHIFASDLVVPLSPSGIITS